MSISYKLGIVIYLLHALLHNVLSCYLAGYVCLFMIRLSRKFSQKPQLRHEQCAKCLVCLPTYISIVSFRRKSKMAQQEFPGVSWTPVCVRPSEQQINGLRKVRGMDADSEL